MYVDMPLLCEMYTSQIIDLRPVVLTEQIYSTMNIHEQ